MNTYYEGNKVERFLRHTSEFLYAMTVLEVLDDVVKENCYGFEVDHSSQVKHMCLMLSEADHLTCTSTKHLRKYNMNIW